MAGRVDLKDIFALIGSLLILYRKGEKMNPDLPNFIVIMSFCVGAMLFWIARRGFRGFLKDFFEIELKDKQRAR